MQSYCKLYEFNLTRIKNKLQITNVSYKNTYRRKTVLGYSIMLHIFLIGFFRKIFVDLLFFYICYDYCYLYYFGDIVRSITRSYPGLPVS